MRMKRFAPLAAALLLMTTAHAQTYRWKDERGNTVFSDQPPSGSVRDARRIDTKSAPVATSADEEIAPEKPTPAEREKAFRQRQQELRGNMEKLHKDEVSARQRKEACERTRRHLQTLESGERIALTDAQGERYIMEDEERAREMARARGVLQSECRQ